MATDIDRYPLGQPVSLSWETTDATGTLVTPDGSTLTATHEGGTMQTLTLTTAAVGVHVLDGWIPPLSGRWTLRFAATGLGAGADETVVDVTATLLGHVTVADLREYLGDVSVTDATLADALAAEQSAQADRCRIDPYTAALREALLRRVARNLAARAVPIATFTSFEGGGTSSRVPQVDAEISRFEAPYRRRKVG
jgi:hypothetical protein